MLGGDVQGQLPVLLGHGICDLTLKIKLFLLSAIGAATQTVWRLFNGFPGLASGDALCGHDEGAFFHRIFNRQDCWQFFDQDFRAFCSLTRIDHLSSHDHRYGLSDKLNNAIGQKGVIMNNRATVVLSRDVLGREHSNDAVLFEQLLFVHPLTDQLAVGDGGQNQGRVDGPSKLGNVIGIDGLARDVQMCRLMCDLSTLLTRRDEILYFFWCIHAAVTSDISVFINFKTKFLATSER